MVKTKNIYIDIAVIFLLLTTTIIFTVVPTLADDNSLLRIVFGIPVVLFIPGYILVAAIFPKRDDIEIVERVAMSLGLSVAILSILGLLLNFIHGINVTNVFIIICTYITILSVIAVHRRRKLHEDSQFLIKLGKLSKPKNKVDFVLTAIFIFVSILAIGAVYHVITYPKIDERFTEFYILDSAGGTNYSYNLKSNLSVTFMVGVVNHEYSPINYTVQMVLDGNVLNDKELILNHNEKWKENVTFTPSKSFDNAKLEFFLFREDNLTVPYRSLYLRVNSI